jgi:transposase
MTSSFLLDEFHVMRHLNEALDQERKREYARLSGRERRYTKGQKHTLPTHRENLALDGGQSLKALLAANTRIHTAYLRKESLAYR